MELIERETAIATLEKHGAATDFGTYLLRHMPTVAAAPVVYGRWIMRGGRFRCSVCDGKALWRDVGGTGGWSHEYEQATTDVCPSCGARMDLPEGGEK